LGVEFGGKVMREFIGAILFLLCCGLASCDDAGSTPNATDVGDKFRDATASDSTTQPDTVISDTVDTVDTVESDVTADIGFLDTDSDGIPDEVDNCTQVANPLQEDRDIDGRGDVCDGDLDGDGIPNAVDLAPNDPNFPGVAALGAVYGHSAKILYRMNVDTYQVTNIGPFVWPNDTPDQSMTDLAIDQFGTLFGISYEYVYTCNPSTAVCTQLAILPEQFNGLTVVPVGTVSPNQEALVGVSNSGNWVWIQVSGTTATLVPLGSYGGNYTSSGDAFSIGGVGTFASVDKGLQADDVIVEVNPATGQVLREIGTLSGYGNAWGLAGWTGRVFAFDAGGAILEVDIGTGTHTVVANTSVEWWGAGVGTVKN